MTDKAPELHEVWVNPGFPEQQQVYRGPDADTAALSYANAVQVFYKSTDEVIWTIDGRAHQHQRRRATVEG